MTFADGGAPGYYGGAMYNNGATVTVTDTVFSGNSANDGGAISGYSGSVTVVYSTYSGNSGSAGDGGAISDYYGASAPPTLTITNDTFSGNSAALAGGVYTEGLPYSFVIKDSHNVFYNNAGGDLEVSSTTGRWIVPSDDVKGKDPMLAVPGNYGGPLQTMIPLPGSAAICEGSPINVPAGFNTDERGAPNTNSAYHRYAAGTPCVDAGSVQTDYALGFSTQPPVSAVPLE